MQEYEYKCVSGPMVIAVRNEKEREKAVSRYEDIMNTAAGKGWEYIGIDDFTVQEPKGCMGMGGSQETMFKMIIFKRLKQGDK